MNHFQAAPTRSHAINTSFILRLTWDSGAHQWRILLKPTAGDDARLFVDMESTFLHVETVMAEQVQKLGAHTLDTELQETAR
jgi:hypothetical protein